jgi:3-oxoadipate enol-lactonase
MAPAVARSLLGKNPRKGSYERLVESMSVLHKQSYLKTIAATVNYGRKLELETISVPTHVVVGDQDTLTPPAMSRELARRIRGARLTIIEDAGHLSNIEQPEAFNRAVFDFVIEHRNR